MLQPEPGLAPASGAGRTVAQVWKAPELISCTRPAVAFTSTGVGELRPVPVPSWLNVLSPHHIAEFDTTAQLYP